MTHGVEVRFGGAVYDGWLSLSLSAGLDRLARTVSLETLDDPWPVVGGEAVTVTLDGAPLLAGWIERIGPSVTGAARRLTVQGRSRVGDLVDAAPEIRGGQWKRQTLPAIAADLVAPFGLSVRSQVPTGAAFPDVQWEPGRTVFERLEELAKQRGLLLADDAAGDLLLTNAGAAGDGPALTWGESTLEASAEIDQSGRRSEVVVLGQQPVTDLVDVETARGVRGRALDGGVGRYRPQTIVASGNVDTAAAQARARHEVQAAFGKALRLRVLRDSAYRVAAYAPEGYAESGPLWQPNLLCVCDFPELRISETLLVEQVALRVDAASIRCELALVRPQAYAPAPPEPSDTAAAGATDPWVDQATGVAAGGGV
ncbi:phage baseplate assembly protein [Adonisia turfae]